MQIQEYDTLAVSMNVDGVVVMVDECHEELARFGDMGDCLNHYPGLEEHDLAQLSQFVLRNRTALMRGATLFFPMRVVSMGEAA